MASDPGVQFRLFRCQHCGAAIGLIHRGPDRLTRLDVFRKPMLVPDPARADEIRAVDEVDVITQKHAVGDRARLFAVIGLNDGDVLCLHCGATTPWSASQAILDHLLCKLRTRGSKLPRKEVLLKSPA